MLKKFIKTYIKFQKIKKKGEKKETISLWLLKKLIKINDDVVRPKIRAFVPRRKNRVTQ